MKIPAFIKRLAAVCDRESARFALGGVKCESDGKTAKLTATDGRILATVHWKDDDPATVDMVADARQLSSLPAKAFLHPKGVWFDGSTLRATVGTDKTATKVDAIDGRFPQYEKVMGIHDDQAGYVSVRLDAALLGKLCDLSHAMNDDQHKDKGLTLFVKDQQSCVFATTVSEDGQHVARFAIMPLAADDGSYKHVFPARPGAESGNGEPQPAPPPELMDGDAIAEAVTREPEPLGSLVEDGNLAAV
jgi:hypothetical protein